MFEPIRMIIISVGDNLCQNVDIQTDGMCHDGPTIQARVVNAMVKLQYMLCFPESVIHSCLHIHSVDGPAKSKTITLIGWFFNMLVFHPTKIMG